MWDGSSKVSRSAAFEVGVVVVPVMVSGAASTRARLRVGESGAGTIEASAGVSAGPSEGVVMITCWWLWGVATCEMSTVEEELRREDDKSVDFAADLEAKLSPP